MRRRSSRSGGGGARERKGGAFPASPPTMLCLPTLTMRLQQVQLGKVGGIEILGQIFHDSVAGARPSPRPKASSPRKLELCFSRAALRQASSKSAGPTTAGAAEGLGRRPPSSSGRAACSSRGNPLKSSTGRGESTGSRSVQDLQAPSVALDRLGALALSCISLLSVAEENSTALREAGIIDDLVKVTPVGSPGPHAAQPGQGSPPQVPSTPSGLASFRFGLSSLSPFTGSLNPPPLPLATTLIGLGCRSAGFVSRPQPAASLPPPAPHSASILCIPSFLPSMSRSRLALVSLVRHMLFNRDCPLVFSSSLRPPPKNGAALAILKRWKWESDVRRSSSAGTRRQTPRRKPPFRLLTSPSTAQRTRQS